MKNTLIELTRKGNFSIFSSLLTEKMFFENFLIDGNFLEFSLPVSSIVQCKVHTHWLKQFLPQTKKRKKSKKKFQKRKFWQKLFQRKCFENFEREKERKTVFCFFFFELWPFWKNVKKNLNIFDRIRKFRISISILFYTF